MDSIRIENMEFYAYHGHFKEEQIVGNRFIVSVTIDADLDKPAQSDKLEDTLNYQKAYHIIKMEMTKKSHLLENIASRILDALYSDFGTIRSATVKISKMNPPIGGKMDCVSITLTR